MPGDWQELDDVQDLSAIRRVGSGTFEVDEVEPGTFRYADTAPTGGPLGNGWASLEGVAYTRSDLVDGDGRKGGCPAVRRS